MTPIIQMVMFVGRRPDLAGLASRSRRRSRSRRCSRPASSPRSPSSASPGSPTRSSASGRPQIVDTVGGWVNDYQSVFFFGVFLVAALTTSQSTATRTIVPIGLAVGLSPGSGQRHVGRRLRRRVHAADQRLTDRRRELRRHRHHQARHQARGPLVHHPGPGARRDDSRSRRDHRQPADGDGDLDADPVAAAEAACRPGGDGPGRRQRCVRRGEHQVLRRQHRSTSSRSTATAACSPTPRRPSGR